MLEQSFSRVASTDILGWIILVALVLYIVGYLEAFLASIH